MPHYGDMLLHAAVSWRGKPPTYRNGDLGEVGDRFHAAIVSEPEATDGNSLSLTFEYFTGLVFNADYSELDGLRALVNSWLLQITIMEVTATVRYEHQTPYERRDINLWSWWYETTGGSLPGGRGEERESMPDWLQAWEDYLIHRWRYPPRLAGWHSFMRHEIAPNETVRIYVSSGRHRTLNTAYLTVGEARALDLRVWDLPSVVSEGFLPDIQTRVNEYVRAQLGRPRQFPEPDATAGADNGYVFASWAEGLFGLPKAR